MMGSKRRILLLWGAVLLAVGTAQGSSVLPANHINQTYQVGFGQTGLLDTYLSQEAFSGKGITFLSTTESYGSDVWYDNWHTLVQHQLSLSTADDRSGLRSELQGDYSFFVGRVYEWQALTWHGYSNAIHVQAGAMLNGNLGFIYNTGNSNNPAQARLSLNLMPVVAADCHLKVFKRRLEARYELALPLVGVAFSPNYGQSYYEMFSLGNYDHNVVPTTFVSAPNFRQLFTVDYKLWKKASLRIGFLGDYQQLRVNNLKSHVFHNRIMVGYVRSITHLKSKKPKK